MTRCRLLLALLAAILPGIARADVFDDLRSLVEAIDLRAAVTVLNGRVGALETAQALDYTDRSVWTATFSEEFDGPTLDPARWHFDFADGQRSLGGNQERQLYMDPAYKGSCAAPLGVNPFSLSGGILTIAAQPTPAAVKPCIWSMPYVSGMLRSEFAQQYGRFVVRAKLPKGKGLWPAFWLLPVSHVWPPELDPMEAFGAANSRGEGGPTRFHWGLVGGSGGGGWIETGVDLTAAFHVYALEWSASELRYFFDGRLVATAAPTALFQQPFYMIANLAVGGSWPEDPDPSTPFPALLQVDFVRAFQHR